MLNMTDFILNGMVTGDVGQILMQNGFDMNSLRPWIGEDGRTYICRPKKQYNQIVKNAKGQVEYESQPVLNVTATLRKDEWQLLDEAIIQVAKERLVLQADLRSRGLVFTIPNGMGTTVFQTETESDVNEAEITMDGLEDAQNDRPQININNLPLPIIHKEFSFSARQIASSRTMGMTVDTSMAQKAARRVAEGVEKLLLGIAQTKIGATYTFGGGTVYGYSNFPSRLTKTFTTPDGTNQATTIAELLAAREQLTAAMHYGPYMIYVGASWDQWLDGDYDVLNRNSGTLRERILKTEGFQGITRSDYLTGYSLFIVQMTSDVIRTVIGMDMTTVQWPEKGGLKQNFKVMTIQVPQLRADDNSNTGILHGTV